MTNKDKAKLKDKILSYCSENTKATITNRHLTDHFSTDYSVIYALTQDLIYCEYIKNHADIASAVDYTDDDKILLITPKGRYFLNYEGGSISEYKRKKLRSIWNVTKITAAAANALIIVCVSIWGISVNSKAKELESTVAEKDEIIQNQMENIQVLENTVSELHKDTIINK
jgi:cell division protein FtsL